MRGHHLLKIAGSILILAATSLGSVRSASAFTVTNNGANDAKVNLVLPYAHMDCYYGCGGVIEVGGPTVYRTASYSGTQVVTVKALEWVVDNFCGLGTPYPGRCGWTKVGWSTKSVTLRAGEYGWVDPTNFVCTTIVSCDNSTHLIQEVITWKTTSGTVLGSRTITFGGSNDVSLGGWVRKVTAFDRNVGVSFTGFPA